MSLKSYYQNSRPELMPFLPQEIKAVLEVGCGSGVFLSELKNKYPGVEVWGIEIESKAAAIAKKLGKILVGPAEKKLTQCPKKHFDLVVCNDVLEHMVDPYSFLNQLKPHFTKEGRILASIPNVRNFHNLKEVLLRKDWQYKDDGILDRTHLRFFTKKSMIAMFEEQGYEIEKIEGINHTGSRTFKLLNLLTLGSQRDMAFEQFAIVAKPVNA